MTTSILDLARSYVAAGLSVIPISASGEKAPGGPLPRIDDKPTWIPYQQKIATEDEIQSWWERRQGQGVGIVGGSVSGNLLIIDFEDYGAFKAWGSEVKSLGFVDAVYKCPWVSTPRGGMHVYLRCAEPVAGNQKLAYTDDKQILVETRGEKGYVLAPGCPGACHPSGGTYELKHGAFASIPVISEEELSHWLAAAQSLTQWAPEQKALPPPAKKERESGALRPGDDYDERGDVRSLLERHGWKFQNCRGEEWYVSRPGKQKGISATFGYKGTRLFIPFSTNADPFEANKAYSPFSVYTLLEHGGKFPLAASQLAKEGYGSRPTAPPSNSSKKSKSSVPRTEAQGEDLASPFEDDKPELIDIDDDPQAESNKTKDLELAEKWAQSKTGKHFMFLDGDMWWNYAGGIWYRSSTSKAEVDVQNFLTKLQKSGDGPPVTAARIRNVVFLSRPFRGGVHDMNEFNAHKNWVPLRNGVYDVITGTLHPHRPENMLTRMLPFDYDAEAKCRRWDMFITETMKNSDGSACLEWMEALQEWFGYCLVPDSSLQKCMFWVGEGQNGKGVATRVLEKLAVPATGMSIENLDKEYSLANLHGKLLALVNEPSQKAMEKNGDTFKAIVGGDLLEARHPAEKVFSYSPYCRVVISCNRLPSTRDSSFGFFRRPIIIEWRYNVSADEADPQLDAKLADELPGIFNWAVAGLRRLRERGRFADLAESAVALEKYKSENDSVRRFVEECCERQEGARETASYLYGRYKSWAEEQGQKWPVTAVELGHRLNALGFKRDVQRVDGKTARVWGGLKYNSEKEPSPEEPAMTREIGRHNEIQN